MIFLCNDVLFKCNKLINLGNRTSFKELNGFTGGGGGMLSIKCTTQHRPVSSIKTTITRPHESPFIQMSSTAPIKESTIAVNNRKDAYVLSNGNVYIKFSSNNSTSADVEKKLLTFPKYSLEYQYC